MSQNEPGFNELPAAAEHSAVHLELRDSYGVGDEAEDFEPGLVRAGVTSTRRPPTGRRGLI